MIKSNIPYSKSRFPCGELKIQIDDYWQHTPDKDKTVVITFTYESNEDLIELLLYCDAVKRLGFEIYHLVIPYFPYSRQDRICNLGESFSLKVIADLINSIEAKRVWLEDPHSDVLPALINNCTVTEQWEFFAKYFKDERGFYLISPDGGALKKIYKLASKVNCAGVVECSKHRDLATGEILSTVIHHPEHLSLEECYIVDDICDGGRTFIEIAKLLRQEYNAKKIVLMVTHGFFTKGLQIFDGLIDEIYTRKGKVK